MSKTVIFPSDIFSAAESYEKKLAAKYAKEGTPDKETNPFGAFRINFDSPNNTTYTTYFKFEVNLVNGGWTPVSLKFFNLKHVGRINPLIGGDTPRGEAQVKAVQVLFKEDYVFDRQIQVDGKIQIIKERYGAAKDLINKAYLKHVGLAKRKGNLPKNASITAIVKRTKNKKGKNGIIEKVPIDGPGNINVALKFMSEKGKQPDQENPNTTFRSPILDARFKRANRVKDDWAWDDARLEDDNGDRSIQINNGNIHKYIRGGSLISGVDNMGSVCLSQGQSKISLPSKLDVCIVRPTKPQRVSQADFDDDDMATIDAATEPEPEPLKAGSEIDTGVSANTAQDGEFDEIGDLDNDSDAETANDATVSNGDDFGDPTPDDDDDLFADDI